MPIVQDILNITLDEPLQVKVRSFAQLETYLAIVDWANAESTRCDNYKLTTSFECETMTLTVFFEFSPIIDLI